MKTFIGKEAFDFTVPAIMPDNVVNENFNLRNYVSGKKALLLFYPLNFTFVCPSEIIALDKRIKEFEDRGCSVLTISVDSHFSHLQWKNTEINQGGISSVKFPMISDLNKSISCAYNVLSDAGVALRGTFIIDEKFILRHMLINDLGIGRNIDENLRTLDAIDHHQKHGDVCPAGWKKGDDAMSPTSSGVQAYLKDNSHKL